VADPAQQSQLERWVSFGASVVAPATVLSAVLFYFGYVSSRAQYAYFGVDVDTIGLSTQDYVMRSPQPLLFPLLVLTLVGVGAMLLHNAVNRRLIGIYRRPAAQLSEPERAERAQTSARVRRVAHRLLVTGLVVFGVGAILLISYPSVRDWPLYNLVTPIVIALGVMSSWYASHVLSQIARLEAAAGGGPPPGGGQPPGLGGAPPADRDGSVLIRRTAAVLVVVVVVATLFWATATVAQWSGRGVAKYTARHLDELPSVILDTKERLYLRDPGVEETALPAAADQDFRYRYRRLRLLIQGHDRMFLVPDGWSASDSTLVVPLDDSVRAQFQFQNDPP
jgi:hypothetical protein